MRLPASLAVASTLLLAMPLQAQGTADQARLIFSVGAGYVGDGTLWSIAKQPVFNENSTLDTLTLDQGIRSGIGVMFTATYFPSDHVGFTAGANFLGLGIQRNCRIAFTTSPGQTQSLCLSIDGTKEAQSAVELDAGVVFRAMSHQPISPYARFSTGLTFTQHSTIRTSGFVPNGILGGVDEFVVYQDTHVDRLHTYFSAGGGLTFAVAHGYQLRIEGRDNIVRLPIVAAPTTRENLQPLTAGRTKHIFSLMFAFDVVLERRRGRRY